MAKRYKTYRASTDPNLHVICREGLEHFDKLPQRIRHMGPWQGSREGTVAAMRAHYRALLAEQGFVVLFIRQDLLKIERKQNDAPRSTPLHRR